MKRIVGILTLVALIAIIVVQLKLNKSTTENRVYHFDKETPLPVFAEVINFSGGSNALNFSGLFEAANEVKLSSEVQGLIENVLVEEGAKVKKGQALVRINDDNLQNKLAVINTQIEGLKKDEVRYTNLMKEDAIQGVKLEKIQVGLETMMAERKSVLDLIEKSIVRAPFDGTISMKFCETGGFAAPAVPLFEIVNLNQMKFVINVPENQVDLFINTANYFITSDSDPTKKIGATLLQSSSKGNFGNSFKIEFLVDKSSGIRSKMFGTLNYQGQKTQTKQLEIPRQAILGSESRPEVYLIKKGKAVRTPVSIYQRKNETLLLNSGVSEGDTIIIGGFINLFDNANVKVANNK